jgi:adenine phosphoribosyltransferase
MPAIPDEQRLQNSETLRGAIRSIPDFPKPGILFRDISPLLEDAFLFRSTIDLLAMECEGMILSKVVGLDARGFIFGAALAYKLGVGFVPVRKKGKLPSATLSHSYDLEYGSATLEIHCDSIRKGESVIVVDDLLATGGTAGAAIHLLQKLGAVVAGLLVVIELGFLQGRNALGETRVKSLVSYTD